MYPGLKSALTLLPAHIAEEVMALGSDELGRIDEIRLRIGRPVTLTCRGGSRVLNASHGVTKQDLEATTTRAFRNSLHSSIDQLCAGFVTYDNGCRVGMTGTAAAENGSVTNVRQISSLCIRIPREVKGCGGEIFTKCLDAAPASLLLCGAPSSGKTTYLRDLTRLCGARYRTALIDERGELAAVSFGLPQNDVGLLTDVFDRYPRGAAIETAVRVMSPQIIVCDEIGSAEDLKDLSYAMDSGVKLICTCHCGSLDELNRRPNISTLIEMGVFDHIVWLEGCGVRAMLRGNELACLASSVHC